MRISSTTLTRRRAPLLTGSRLLAAVLAAPAFVAGAGAAEPFGPVSVTVTAKACEPNEITVPAGQVTFTIINKSTRLLEWEILKGVLVVDERENIAPGFRSKLTTRLEAGTYEVTCGVIGNPKGKLIVTPPAGGPVKPTEADLIGPAADYRVATVGRLGDLDSAIAAYGAAAKAGDLAASRKSFLALRQIYLAMSPIEAAVGAPAAAFGADLTDAETHLFAVDATTPDATVAAKIATDFEAYKKTARALVPTPDSLIKGAATAAGRIEASSRAGTPTSVQLADMEGLAGAVEGVSTKFAPLAARTDPKIAADMKSAIDQLRQAVTAARGTGADAGKPLALSAGEQQALADAGRVLDEQTRRFTAALGF